VKDEDKIKKAMDEMKTYGRDPWNKGGQYSGSASGESKRRIRNTSYYGNPHVPKVRQVLASLIFRNQLSLYEAKGELASFNRND